MNYSFQCVNCSRMSAVELSATPRACLCPWCGDLLTIPGNEPPSVALPAAPKPSPPSPRRGDDHGEQWLFALCAVAVLGLGFLVFRTETPSPPAVPVTVAEPTVFTPAPTVRVLVTPRPATAHVWVDGKAVGTGPVEVTLQGRGRIYAGLPNHHDAEYWYDTTQRSDPVALTLKPHPARLTLTVSPAEAVVEADRAGAKVTGAEAQRVVEVTPDEGRPVLVRVNAPGYEETVHSWAPAPGGVADHKLDLTPIAAVFALKVTPADATITVGAGEAEINGAGRERSVRVVRPDLHPVVSITVERKGYHATQRVLHPRPGHREAIALSLQEIPLTAFEMAQKFAGKWEITELKFVGPTFEGNITLLLDFPKAPVVTFDAPQESGMGRCWVTYVPLDAEKAFDRFVPLPLGGAYYLRGPDNAGAVDLWKDSKRFLFPAIFRFVDADTLELCVTNGERPSAFQLKREAGEPYRSLVTLKRKKR